MCTTLCGDPAKLHPRVGERPRTTRGCPHLQRSQTAPPALQERLVQACCSLPDVALGRSFHSVPSSRAFFVNQTRLRGPAGSSFTGGEIGHIHGREDGSLHIALPQATWELVIAAGWGEFHPLALSGVVPPTCGMLYAPRDETDYAVAWDLLKRSYAFATTP